MKKFLGLSLVLCGICVFGATAQAAPYTLEGTAFYAFGEVNTGTDYVGEGAAFYAFAAQSDGAHPVYRFINTANGDHFYTIDEQEKKHLQNNPGISYKYEGVAFHARRDTEDDARAVYRFINITNGDHFYTIDEQEKNYATSALSSIYRFEGVAFYAFTEKKPHTDAVHRFHNIRSGDHFYTISDGEARQLNELSTKKNTPVYRFINPSKGSYFFTASEDEKNKILNDSSASLKYEGVAFYTRAKTTSEMRPVFRFIRNNGGDHFYTMSEAEKDAIIKSNPSLKYEGVAFHAFPSQVVGSMPVYRLRNTETSRYFYTISDIERNYVLAPASGPSIAVGLWYYERSEIQKDPFEIEANKPYNIRDKKGNIIAQVGGSTRTKVTYHNDGNLKIRSSISDTVVSEKVTFDAADGDNGSIIFDVHRPKSSYDHYRGSITVRHYRGTDIFNGTTDKVTQIWVINTLPLEHYVWGMGEMSGTGPKEHSKVMTIMFRTYGKWYIDNATKYAPLGFKIRSDSGSQIYRGYDWEKDRSGIRSAADATRGVIMTYKGETALTPYSSWSDGRTRSFEERWGSKAYPWCQSVKDPYGKHASMSTRDLEKAGNHMVGLIANGSLKLAREHKWDYARIMRYYYKNITLDAAY